jgi:large subunit ribosomal protein L10
MERCTIAISTDYTGLAVGAMTDLRRALRERNVQFRVVKNTLAHLAAEAAERPGLKDIVRGPTGIAFGYGDPTEPAKALTEYIRSTRLPIKVMGALMGERTLTADEVSALALLPSREELIARLMGQLQAPVAGLVSVLNAPISGLARVLQRHVEKLETIAIESPVG